MEHQSVLTYKDHIDAQLLLMWSGLLMEPNRTRKIAIQQKAIFKYKLIISNRRETKVKGIRIFQAAQTRDFVLRESLLKVSNSEWD